MHAYVLCTERRLLTTAILDPSVAFDAAMNAFVVSEVVALVCCIKNL